MFYYVNDAQSLSSSVALPPCVSPPLVLFLFFMHMLQSGMHISFLPLVGCPIKLFFFLSYGSSFSFFQSIPIYRLCANTFSIQFIIGSFLFSSIYPISCSIVLLRSLPEPEHPVLSDLLPSIIGFSGSHLTPQSFHSSQRRATPD